MRYDPGMVSNNRYIKSLQELESYLTEHRPTLFTGAKTSTVLPYDELDLGATTVCDLTQLPQSLELDNDSNLVVSGPVTWEHAQQFLRSKGRDIMTSPTESLAHMLAGIATSATGERCFSFGTLRSQVVEIEYLDYNGKMQTLKASDPFPQVQGLKKYRSETKAYEKFKNPPFPRFDHATDLMIGTEGQLGIVTKAKFKTIPMETLRYLFILLPKWEENFELHYKLYKFFHKKRKQVLSVEFVDSNGIEMISGDLRPGTNQDVLFLEIKQDHFDQICSELLDEIGDLEQSIFELDEGKYQQIRKSVPRAIFELNAKMGLRKQGTDVQVKGKKYKDLIECYREGSRLGIKYVLFGHFGDAHLHFNFLPTKDQEGDCKVFFKDLYSKVIKWQGSPFAEHGVGIIKQDYIADFYTPAVREFFKNLKREYDPHNQFFPQGFMNL